MGVGYVCVSVYVYVHMCICMFVCTNSWGMLLAI